MCFGGNFKAFVLRLSQVFVVLTISSFWVLLKACLNLFCCHSLFKRIFLKVLSKYQLIMVASNACSLSVYIVETPRGFFKVVMNHSIGFRSQNS